MDDVLTKIEQKLNSKANSKSLKQGNGLQLTLTATQLDLLARKARAVDSIEPERAQSVVDSLDGLPLLDNCDFQTTDVDDGGYWFGKEKLSWESVRVERAIKHCQSGDDRKVRGSTLPQLHRQLIEIQIQAKPFISTETFDYYHAREVRQHEGKVLSCVLKILRTRAQPDWFARLHSQIIARNWAYAFNALLASRGQRSIHFPEAAILELADREHVFCKADFFEVVEPPWQEKELQNLASAFQHFIYGRTNHKIVCSRLWTDKVCGHFLEPEMHSVDGDLFGQNDRGDDAFYSFVNSHRCNEFCKCVGAPTITDRVYETLRIGRKQQQSDMTYEDSQRFGAIRSRLKSVTSLSLKTKVQNANWAIDLYIFPALVSLRIDHVKITKFTIPPNLTHSIQKLEVIGSADSLAAVLQPDFDYLDPRRNTDPTIWSRLKKLTISDGNIVFTDRCLSHLPSIVKINLSHNQIQAIRNLHECVGLRELDLRNNQISSVAKINQSVGNVQTFLLTSNLITDPSPLSKLFGLKFLDLSFNLISDFSLIKGFAQLPSLKGLWLKGNPLAYTKSYRLKVICELLTLVEEPGRWFELDSIPVTANEIKKAKKVAAGEEECEDGIVEPSVEFISFAPFRKVIPLPIGVRFGDQEESSVLVKRKKRNVIVQDGPLKPKEVENAAIEEVIEPKVEPVILTSQIDDDFDLAMEYFSSNISLMPVSAADRCKALMKQATVGDCPYKKVRMFTRSASENEGDALWATYQGMSSLDAKRLFLQTLDHFDENWRTRGSSPLDMPDIPSKLLRTFVAEKSKNQDASLAALRDEFGIDLMQTFSFHCECEYDETCPERPSANPCEHLIILSHFVIQEKDISTQSTRYRRRTNLITNFEVYAGEILVNFMNYSIRYRFLSETEQSLFERKLATAILTDGVYRFLQDDKFMGRVPKLHQTPHKKHTGVKLSRLSQELLNRNEITSPKLYSLTSDNLAVSITPSAPMSIQSSCSPSLPYTDSIDTENLVRSKRELSDAVKRFWNQRQVGKIDDEFTQRYSCRLLRIKSNGQIGERNIIILVWEQHIFVLYSKGKREGTQPSNIFYGHISSLLRIERGFHDQYFTLDFIEKSYTFITRDPRRTLEICSRLDKSRADPIEFRTIVSEEESTLRRILKEVEPDAKVKVYSHVYVPTNEKTRTTFTMRSGLIVNPQTLILTNNGVYLCDEDHHFIMNSKSLTQSKRRKLERSQRFRILKQKRAALISQIESGEAQGFLIKFSDESDPWHLISQTSGSNLLNDLQSKTKKLLNSFSSPSSSLDNHPHHADLERIEIDLP